MINKERNGLRTLLVEKSVRKEIETEGIFLPIISPIRLMEMSLFYNDGTRHSGRKRNFGQKSKKHRRKGGASKWQKEMVG